MLQCQNSKSFCKGQVCASEAQWLLLFELREQYCLPFDTHEHERWQEKVLAGSHMKTLGKRLRGISQRLLNTRSSRYAFCVCIYDQWTLRGFISLAYYKVDFFIVAKPEALPKPLAGWAKRYSVGFPWWAQVAFLHRNCCSLKLGYLNDPQWLYFQKCATN